MSHDGEGGEVACLSADGVCCRVNHDVRQFSPSAGSLIPESDNQVFHVNTCRDILRTCSEKVSLTEFSSTASLRPRLGQDYLTPFSLSSRSEEAELVRIAIGRLPEEQRIVLMLRYVEHMSYEEVALYLEVPPSTVRGRLYHAKRALRGLLESGIHPKD